MQIFGLKTLARGCCPQCFFKEKKPALDEVLRLTGREEEKEKAEARIRALEQESGKQVWISVEPFRNFYPAEEEHQDYYLKNPEAFEEEMIRSGRKGVGNGK